jgi:hypothetical protein
MANTIVHKRSSVPGKVPVSLQLSLGELAINVADGRVFVKKTDDTVVEITRPMRFIDGGLLVCAADPTVFAILAENQDVLTTETADRLIL